MKHLSLILLLLSTPSVAWGLWPGAVFAQVQALIMDRSLQDNEFLYGTVTSTRGQIIILNNGENPCLGVSGLGARTRLTPNAAANTAGNFIITQNSNCIEPIVEHVSLFGNHGVPDYPSGEPVVETANAITLNGDAVIARFNQIYDFEGWGIGISGKAGELSGERRVARIHNNNISHCNTGIYDAAGDSCIADNTVANVATYGIRVAGGAAQLSGNHCFGCETSIYFEGGSSRSTNDKASDAVTGFNIGSSSAKSSIAGLTSIQCAQRNVFVQATDCQITGSSIFVSNSADNIGVDYDSDAGTPIQAVGVQITNERCSITDSFIELTGVDLGYATGTPRSSIGITIAANCHNQTIHNVRLEGTTQANQKGIWIAPDVKGLAIDVTSTGGEVDFSGSGSAIVYFADDATPDWQGTVDITYAIGDTPVRIPAGWDDRLEIRVRAGGDNGTASPWFELTPGTAYP